MTSTTQNLITRKSRAAEKIELWMGINRRATASVCDADAYQDVNERTTWADISTREIRKLRALIAQLDAEIAAAEQVAEEIAEDVAPVAEYAEVIATRLADAFSRTPASAVRTRGVLDTLLADAEPTPMTPDEIRDALHAQADRADDASAEVYELCEGVDEHAEHIDAAYEAALGAEDCRIEAIDLMRELRALQQCDDWDRDRQIGLIQYELEQLLRIATEHADRAEDILSTVHATR